MSHPASAILLPLPDIPLSLPPTRKLRTVAHLSHFDPPQSIGLLCYDRTAMLIDLSLCVRATDHADARGGWHPYRLRNARALDRLYPPELRAKLMCIGYQERVETPYRLDWHIPTSSQTTTPIYDPRRILRVILAVQLEWSFDIHQWVYAARLRSAYEWRHTQLDPNLPIASTTTAADSSTTTTTAQSKANQPSRAKVEVIELSD
ncbi:hypothetical protein ACQY0O_007232 [Thecaphora frezii]